MYRAAVCFLTGILLPVLLNVPVAAGQNITFLGQEPFTSYVSSGAVKDSHVYRLLAVSIVDADDPITYTIQAEDSNTLSYFKIASGNLIQTAKHPLPQQSLFILTIEATQGDNSISANLTVNILPTSQTSPVFEHDSYIASVFENGAEDELVLLTQAFSLAAVGNEMTYFIASGNTDGAFLIDGTTGVISTSKTLDRETYSQYTLSISYIDAEGSAYTTINVDVLDVNDNSPMFTQSLYTFVVNETDYTEYFVGKVVVSDADIGSNGEISMSINDAFEDDFSITSQGEIFTQIELDYETTPQYTIQIIATDEGSPPNSATTTIMIRVTNSDDECPVFSNSNSKYAKDLPYDPLNPPSVGVVLTISATDPDNLGNVTYKIISGNELSYFELDSKTGNISLVKIDDDITGQYMLTVSANDASCIDTSTATVEIAIGNTNKNTPQFTTESCTAQLWENPSPGTSVIVLEATDGDIGTFGQIRYDVVQNVGDSSLFALDPNTGNLTTTGSPEKYNREERSSFSVGVTATDGGFHQDFCLLHIDLLDLNDNQPLFDVEVYSITIGNVNNDIIQVEAQDPDIGDNGDVTYSITSGVSDNCPFSIGTYSGVLRVSDNNTVNQDLCIIQVTATDGGGLSSTVFVNVTMLNGADVPVFTQAVYSVVIEENLPIDTSVITVNASSSSDILYTLLTGSEYRTNGESTFLIDSTSGEISVGSNSLVDYEKLYPGPYSFRILVSAATSSSNSIAVVDIQVTDKNDNDPTFGGLVTISLNVVEERLMGNIGVIQAMDLDNGTNGAIEYSYEYSGSNPNGDGVFMVHTDGTVELLVSGLDAEDPDTLSVYMFQVTAYNPNFPSSGTGTAFLNINIKDINDSPPTFDQSSYSKTLNETHLVSSTILKVSATDPDSVDLNNLVYNILSGNEGATFQVNSNNGDLILKRALDYESIKEYNMVVEVTDGIHQDTATIAITVLDIDDEPPIFTASQYTASIVENAAFGTSVLTVEAIDVDSKLIVFEVKGQAEGRFSIDSNGVLSVSGGIDREEFLPSAQMFFLIFAYGGSLGTTDVIVNVSDVNDYTPKFLLSPYFGTAPENTPPGSEGLYVVTVKAIDLDEGRNGTVTYSIVSGEENGFRINATSGTVTAITTFDREQEKLYNLTVQAIDNGIPIQLLSTVEVFVEISDHNDNSPYWPYPYMYARVYENVQSGKSVIVLPVKDPDNGINSSVTFTLTGGNSGGKFSLDSTTGEIKVDGALDYEDPNDRVHRLYFSIRDNGNPPNSSQEIGELEIHVLDSNDHKPVFENPLSFITLSEDTPPGNVVLVVTATDEDSTSNGRITYSIQSGNIKDIFTIKNHNNGSGLLYLQTALDHEEVSIYNLVIRASDEGYPIEHSDLQITIAISDINDEPPLFSQDILYASVLENSPSSISVIQVLANDLDSDDIEGGRVSEYVLVGGGDGDFKLDENNWIVSVPNLDREETSEYNLTVIAIDDDTVNPLTGTVTIVITVLDVNDNPSSNGAIMNIIILAYNGLFPKQQLGMAYFDDPDDNDTFTQCSISAGDDHLFTIDTNDCTVSLAVDNPQPGIEFMLTVEGNDGLHSSVHSTIHISVFNVSVDPTVLLTISVNSPPNQFLQDVYFNIADQLSSAISSTVTLFSVQNPINKNYVDVTFYANDLSKTEILQRLYLNSASFPFDLHSLPTDPCISEPCMNLGECQVLANVSGITNKLTSKQLILITPTIDQDYQCNCPVGTTGNNCDVNYNDCYSNPCQYSAECTDGFQDYTCNCPSGTFGKDCSINPDECAIDTSPCYYGASCSNGYGSPLCSCHSDFYGNLCQYGYFKPSNYCDPNPCDNGATCSPGRDSYTCLCTTDFSGTNCERPVQFQGGCVNNPCYNGSTCTETLDGYVCECSVGFTGPLCRFPLNNCELEYCRNGICEVGVYGSYRCSCDEGYMGEDCTLSTLPCDLNDQLCLNNGKCMNNGTTNYYCECDKDYYGDACQYAVIPIDLCSDSQCDNSSSICTSGQSSFTCFCINGAGGEHCDRMNQLDPCDSNPCWHGSTCTSNGNTNFTCACSIGYTGTTCKTNINECLETPCSNGGTCVDGVGSYLCNCVEGFAGRQCDVTCPIGHVGESCEIIVDNCLNDPCENGGTCKNYQGTYKCTCTPDYTGPQCDIANDCSTNTCHNEGACINDPTIGHYCNCQDDRYHGNHCELTTVSFSGNSALPSYRAYDPLGFRGRGTIELEFATRSSNGLLLLVTQYQEGRSLDFLAVEIIDGTLRVMYSLGDALNSVVVMSSALRLSNGEWHTIEITVQGKEVSVSVDHCNLVSDLLTFDLDCIDSVTSNGSLQFLDATLPLWLGGAPSVPLGLPLGSRGIDGCVRNVIINGHILDLDSHVDELNSNNGCPQIDDSCDVADCGQGSCVPEWNSYYCNCPTRLTGDNCNTGSHSLSYSGTTYAQYVLSVNPPSSKRQVTTAPSLITKYGETVSLWFRTKTAGGVLLLLGNTSSDHMILKLSRSGNVVYSLTLNGVPYTLTLSQTYTDGFWHNISLYREGSSVKITYDGIYSNELTITGDNPPLLSYNSDQVYAAGMPGTDGSVVVDGYSGCLQDIRFEEQPLPTSGTNDVAGVVFIGEPPLSGCNVGPCFPNPCGSEGNCSEIDETSYQCSCNTGVTVVQSSCERTRKGDSISSVIGIIVALTMFFIILIIVMIVGLTVAYKNVRKHNKKRESVARLNHLNRLHPDIDMDEFEVHENIYHYDNEDGEDDTSLVGHTQENNPATPLKRVKPVTEPDDNEPRTYETPSIPKKPPLSKNRPTTPEINSFIESRVNGANRVISDIDSLRSYNDEGVLSAASSLSTICSNTGHEPYSITTLRLAGPDFERIADLLEPVFVEDGDELSVGDYESGFEGEGGERHIKIALVHNYK